MSKLAHSDDEIMNEIERRRAIEDGNEDCLDDASKWEIRARRLAQTIYLHCNETQIRKSLPPEDAEYVLRRMGAHWSDGRQ